MSETRIRNNWRIARKKILLQRCHLIQHSKSHASHEHKTSSRRDCSVDIIGLYLFWNIFPWEETNFYFYSLPFKRKLLLKKSYQFGFAIILRKNTVEKECLPAFFRWVRWGSDVQLDALHDSSHDAGLNAPVSTNPCWPTFF